MSLAFGRPRGRPRSNWIDTAFDRAERAYATGVLLLMQAEPTATPGTRRARQ